MATALKISKVERKYRRKEIGNRGDIEETIFNWKGVHIITAEVCPDHVYIGRNSIQKSISSFMGFLE